MAAKNLVDGMNIDGDMRMLGKYKDCIYGKHATHPFNDNGEREKEVLEHVHMDIWGPTSVHSAGGGLYFMLIIDGHSSFQTVAIISSKSADVTLKVFKAYHIEAKKQTGKKLQRIHLDMGREWYNKAWKTYQQDHGLVFEFSAPYTHQQNSVAEQSMYILLDITWSTLTEAKLLLKYWADAIQTMVYVRNLILSLRNPGIIPVEAWFRKRQDISHLWPFRTTTYTHVPTEISSSKLHPRSVKLVLIDYYSHQAYKLLDRTTGAIHKSRDVIFEEERTNFTTKTVPIGLSIPDDPLEQNTLAMHPINQDNNEQTHNHGMRHGTAPKLPEQSQLDPVPRKTDDGLLLAIRQMR